MTLISCVIVLFILIYQKKKQWKNTSISIIEGTKDNISSLQNVISTTPGGPNTLGLDSFGEGQDNNPSPFSTNNHGHIKRDLIALSSVSGEGAGDITKMDENIADNVYIATEIEMQNQKQLHSNSKEINNNYNSDNFGAILAAQNDDINGINNDVIGDMAFEQGYNNINYITKGGGNNDMSNSNNHINIESNDNDDITPGDLQIKYQVNAIKDVSYYIDNE